jgi:hypothetical protein
LVLFPVPGMRRFFRKQITFQTRRPAAILRPWRWCESWWMVTACCTFNKPQIPKTVNNNFAQ